MIKRWFYLLLDDYFIIIELILIDWTPSSANIGEIPRFHRWKEPDNWQIDNHRVLDTCHKQQKKKGFPLLQVTCGRRAAAATAAARALRSDTGWCPEQLKMMSIWTGCFCFWFQITHDQCRAKPGQVLVCVCCLVCLLCRCWRSVHCNRFSAGKLLWWVVFDAGFWFLDELPIHWCVCLIFKLILMIFKRFLKMAFLLVQVYERLLKGGSIVTVFYLGNCSDGLFLTMDSDSWMSCQSIDVFFWFLNLFYRFFYDFWKWRHFGSSFWTAAEGWVHCNRFKADNRSDGLFLTMDSDCWMSCQSIDVSVWFLNGFYRFFNDFWKMALWMGNESSGL